MKTLNTQIQETKQTPNKLNTKKAPGRYIILRWIKISDKETIFKNARKKKDVYRLYVQKHIVFIYR